MEREAAKAAIGPRQDVGHPCLFSGRKKPNSAKGRDIDAQIATWALVERCVQGAQRKSHSALRRRTQAVAGWRLEQPESSTSFFPLVASNITQVHSLLWNDAVSIDLNVDT